MSARTGTTLTVRDVMTASPLAVSMGTTVRELAELLVENEISGVPVLDARDRVIGVVSKTDLLARCLHQPLHPGSDSFSVTIAEGLEIGVDLDPEDLGTVEELMTTDPMTARPDEPVAKAARRMAQERVHRIIVVNDQDQAVGIVTSLDLLKVFPNG